MTTLVKRLAFVKSIAMPVKLFTTFFAFFPSDTLEVNWLMNDQKEMKRKWPN